MCCGMALFGKQENVFALVRDENFTILIHYKTITQNATVKAFCTFEIQQIRSVAYGIAFKSLIFTFLSVRMLWQ